MLAHQFSVSKFPSKRKPKKSVGKKQLMADTIEAATKYVFSHLDEPCLVGTFSVREHGSRKVAYARAYYYQEKLESYMAMILNYHADAYPITWDFSWNKPKSQYEVRVMAQYRPEVAYNESDESSFVSDMQEAKRLLDETETELLAMRDRLVEQKQVNAIKQAMDNAFFGGQS